MRFSLMMATLVAGLALAGGAQAQDAAAQDGMFSPDLQRIMTAAADSECLADLMHQDLLDVCNSQIGEMGPGLGSLGPATSVTFVKAEGEGAERVETYDVFYESGIMLTWVIGAYSEGKYSVIGVTG